MLIFFGFQIFCIAYMLTFNFFDDTTFSQISLYFINFFFFYQKYIHLVLSKSFLYIVIFGQNMNKGMIFLSSLQQMKYLKSCLPKENYQLLLFFKYLYRLLKQIFYVDEIHFLQFQYHQTILHQKNFLCLYFLKQQLLITIIKPFFSFYNIFFYAQLVFIFHLLVDFCIFDNHIVAFCLFLFQKDFDIFHELLLQSFLLILIIFS